MLRNFCHRLIVGGCAALLFAAILPQASATELIRITAENYERVVPKGKEVDAIYGDWVLRNKHVVAVIAHPTPGRKANMTVRGVGGMLIDYSTRFHSSDQLSCFYPTAGRYLFENEETIVVVENGKTETKGALQADLLADSISIAFEGISLAGDDTSATVRYNLADNQQYLSYTVEIQNAGEKARQVAINESLRCDGDLFRIGTTEDALFAEDAYFGQCYLFQIEDREVERAGSGRKILIQPLNDKTLDIAGGDSSSWSGKVYCSQSLMGAKNLMLEAKENPVGKLQFLVRSNGPSGPVAHAPVEFLRDGESVGTALTNEEGWIRTSLPPGEYSAKVRAEGHEVFEQTFVIDPVKPAAVNLSLKAGSRVRVKVVDETGTRIPAKVQFYAADGAADPDFGPTSAIAAVKNAVYTASGSFEQALDPGAYQVYISRGPEYDADVQVFDLKPGQLMPISSTLKRTVDTSGWVSAEFHSHSSPSGDNVSHQRGRVMNLLAEHLEFAPCTEHNRIDTYADDLKALKASQWMATCTGMELTGGPLPINHQNAFPLVMHEHRQDGGGPQTDSDPVKQIERLALWDNSSPKVVQTNHPNIPAILGDRDVDGSPDDGFRGMLGWMDTIEIHPIENIFTPPSSKVAPNKRDERAFYWMQLMNLGYRIPGVVNTDAHYNFHGSGWLRNYIKCSTDNPAGIQVAEMIHSVEHGHMTMTTGPFLEAEIRQRAGGRFVSYAVGDDLDQTGQELLWIRVQCPNWFDVNRVQVFANGRPLEDWNFTRKSHPELFPDKGAKRFEFQQLLPTFEEDTHVIVATIGEGLTLGTVMGKDAGKRPPVALTNPFFLDVDGGGFQGNGDDLGVPFMLDIPEAKAK